MIIVGGLFNFINEGTAWKVSVFGVLLVYIFSHSDWKRGDTEYPSIFSPNAGKYGPEKLRIRTFSRSGADLGQYLKYLLNISSSIYSLLQAFSAKASTTVYLTFLIQSAVAGWILKQLAIICSKEQFSWTLLQN